MKIKISFLFGLLLSASPLWGANIQEKVAVLPFVPTDGGDPREGLGLSAKLFSRFSPALSLDWRALGLLMEENGLDKRRLLDPSTLRRIGQILSVDEVLIGAYSTQGTELAATARLISVKTGAVAHAPEWRVARNFSVPIPPLTVEAPSLIDQDEALALRDSPSDSLCEGAADHVDRLESHILDLKARYWALQLKKGVAMSTLKFNPGSTITDPELKGKFYARMGAWFKEEIVPELTPAETKVFAEIDEQAFQIARRCAIL